VASANLDLVRSLYTAWERGDFSRPVDWAHPEIEFVFADGPAPGSWRGVAGMVEGFGDFLRTWEEVGLTVEEYRELDDARVLVLVQYSGRGKTSGLELGEMRTRTAGLFHLRDGKVTRLVLYWDRERAFSELGLAPEGGSSPQ
jgi:ketosteroid isomerase-like protein